MRQYFDGCNSGDLDELLLTLDADVVHYFLPAALQTIRGAEHLARYWRKYKRALDPVWSVDRTLAQGNEVVSEWSCIWTPPATARRLMLRRSEWYVMRDSRILEIRAYFIYDAESHVELPAFPYADRGYLCMRDARSERSGLERSEDDPGALCARIHPSHQVSSGP